MPKKPAFMLSVVAACLLVLSAARAFADPVEVHVLLPDGRPAPGATVVYELPREASRTFRSATADAAGHARIELKPLERGQFRSRGTLVAYAAGYAPSAVEPPKDAEAAGITIKVAMARKVSGLVRDAKGAAVVGARVSAAYIARAQMPPILLQSFPISEDASPLAPQFESVTDIEGRYSFTNLPPEGNTMLRIDDSRYFASRLWIDLAKDEVPVMVTRPGASLAGRVLQDGDPAVGVRVFAQSVNGRRSWGAAAETDKDGHFLLFGLATGTYNVMTNVPASRERVAPSIEIAAHDGQTRTVPDIMLEKGSIIQGTVRDAQTRAGVARVQISVFGPHRPKALGNPHSVLTDAAGRYQLRVPAGESIVMVKGAPEHLTPEALMNDGKTVRVAATETSTVDFELAHAASLTGITRDENGQPVGGVMLRTLQRGNWLEARSGPDGRFEFEALEPRDIALKTMGPWQVVSPTKFSVPAKDAVVTVKKRRTTPLGGRILDAAGAPVAGATIKLGAYLADEFAEHRQLVSDEQGRYLWPDAPGGGETTIEIYKNGWRIVVPPVISSNSESIGVDGDLRPNPFAIYSVTDAVMQPVS